MNDQDVNTLLDAYRDGTLNDEDAKRLATMLKQDNEETALVMEELTFQRLLSEALSDTGSKRFVKSLLERLSAENEESKVDFSTTFRKRQEVDAERRVNPANGGALLAQWYGCGADGRRMVLAVQQSCVMVVLSW